MRSSLPTETRKQIKSVGRADVLVGIPSFNNAGTIGHVVAVVAEGIHRHFPSLRGVILNSDGGSTDGTREAAAAIPVPPGVTVVSTTYDGIAGKGSAVRAIFEAAHMLGAKACAMVDSDIRSIQPWWVERILGPVQAGQLDYVAPYYVRHKYDGTITNNIAYPMTRALYGLRIRQPIGGDFGFSSALAEHYLHKPVWESDVARFGIDVWMTTTAINDGYRIAQAYLGAKIHDAKDPAASLGPMFRQVVGTLFALLAVYPAKWRHAKGSQPTPMIGEPVIEEPEPVPISRDALVERFREGFRKLGPVWQRVVGPDVYPQLAHAAMETVSSVELAEDLWAKAVYDFAVGFHREDLDPDEVVDALVPIYFGRIAAFAVETDSKNTAEAEEVIERQALVFEEVKPRLIRTWDRG